VDELVAEQLAREFPGQRLGPQIGTSKSRTFGLLRDVYDEESGVVDLYLGICIGENGFPANPVDVSEGIAAITPGVRALVGGVKRRLALSGEPRFFLLCSAE
jgi:hypothetical protein